MKEVVAVFRKLRKLITSSPLMLTIISVFNLVGIVQGQQIPESLMGASITWYTLQTTAGEIQIPGKVSAESSNDLSHTFTIMLPKKHGFSIDLVIGTNSDFYPFDSNRARELATGMGTLTVEKEACKAEGDCYFEVLTASRLNYFVRTKLSADGGQYFILTASTAMGIVDSNSIRAATKAIKASKGEDSLHPELRAIMNYCVNTLK